MNDSDAEVANQGFFSLALSQEVVTMSVKVALVVGTLLAFINHWDKILIMSFTGKSILQVTLTYLVPYSGAY